MRGIDIQQERQPYTRATTPLLRMVLVMCICALCVWASSCSGPQKQKSETGSTGSSENLPPPGQVTGSTVTREGKPAGGVQVLLARMLPEGKVRIMVDHMSPAVDKSGRFVINGIAPGRYILMIFSNTYGFFAFVLSEGKPLTFEMQKDRGVNLGKVDISSLRRISQ